MSQGDFNYKFTVFTPTYNRVRLLPRVYKSLKAQTFRDFEWVIVNDGSSDGTDRVVAEWIDEKSIPIRYFWQTNGGKHTVINRGVKEAQGYFFAILDSDDWYTPHTLERFLFHWNSIPNNQRSNFAGVAGLYAYPTGEVVGTPFPQDVIISDSVDIRVRYGVKGDKVEIYRTEVMREFPFPEDLGKFVTEGLVWNRIAQRYKVLYVNEILAYKEYQPDGLSVRRFAIGVGAPKAVRCYFKEFVSMRRKLPVTVLLRNYTSYVRFSLHAGVSLREQKADIPSRLGDDASAGICAVRSG